MNEGHYKEINQRIHDLIESHPRMQALRQELLSELNISFPTDEKTKKKNQNGKRSRPKDDDEVFVVPVSPDVDLRNFKYFILNMADGKSLLESLETRQWPLQHDIRRRLFYPFLLGNRTILSKILDMTEADGGVVPMRMREKDFITGYTQCSICAKGAEMAPSIIIFSISDSHRFRIQDICVSCSDRLERIFDFLKILYACVHQYSTLTDQEYSSVMEDLERIVSGKKKE